MFVALVACFAHSHREDDDMLLVMLELAVNVASFFYVVGVGASRDAKPLPSKIFLESSRHSINHFIRRLKARHHHEPHNS